MSSSMVAMRHKDSDQPVLASPAQVENMKHNGWTVDDVDSRPKKQRVVKTSRPIENDDNEVNRHG